MHRENKAIGLVDNYLTFDVLVYSIIARIHHKTPFIATVCKNWLTSLESISYWYKMAHDYYTKYKLKRGYSLTESFGNSTLDKMLSQRYDSGDYHKLKLVYYYMRGNKNSPLALLNFHDRDLRITFMGANKQHFYTIVTAKKEIGDTSSYTKEISYQAPHHGVDDDNNNSTVITKKEKEEEEKRKEKFYLSVTTFIHTLFPVFDEDVVIDKMMANFHKWNDPIRNEKYFGMTKEQIKENWKFTRDDACAKGTHMHEQIELYYNNAPHENNTREFELFQQFEEKEIKGKLRAYRTEWMIFTELNRICGSIDMLYEYVDEKKQDIDGKKPLIIYDWKRSKAINFSNRWENGCVPCTRDLDNCNWNIYSIQLRLYAWILETHYDVVIDAMFIVVLHPNQDEYIKLEVKKDHTKMDQIISHRRASIDMK